MPGERKFKFQGGFSRKQVLIRVTDKLGGFDGHPMIEHFKFRAGAHQADAEDDDPVAVGGAFPRTAATACRQSLYPDIDDFYRDLGETYRKAVRAFADAGCRYLQLDEVNLTYLCDPEAAPDRASTAARTPTRCPRPMPRMINAAISDIPADMAITMHLCRGNFRSTFIACGGYEPVAELLFNTINVHGYFMEYDSERAGGFEPLRFVPKGKQVVLGLVTSKSGALESKDEIKRRIDAGVEIRAARPALPVAAMRLRVERRGQYPRRRRAMGEAADDRRARRRNLGPLNGSAASRGIAKEDR